MRKKTMIGLAAAGLAIIPSMRIYTGMNLNWFKPSEFGAALPFLSVGLLQKLDRFRELLGSRVDISPAPGALIRFGRESESQHIYGRAADVLTRETNAQRVYDMARAAGFSGIGIAPVGVWSSLGVGVHLDTRPGRTADNPARWGYIKQSGRQIETSIQTAGVYNVSGNQVGL